MSWTILLNVLNLFIGHTKCKDIDYYEKCITLAVLFHIFCELFDENSLMAFLIVSLFLSTSTSVSWIFASMDPAILPNNNHHYSICVLSSILVSFAYRITARKVLAFHVLLGVDFALSLFFHFYMFRYKAGTKHDRVFSLLHTIAGLAFFIAIKDLNFHLNSVFIGQTFRLLLSRSTCHWIEDINLELYTRKLIAPSWYETNQIVNVNGASATDEKNKFAQFNEDVRVAHMKRFHALGQILQKEYDIIVFLASAICQTPSSLLSFADRDLLHFKAHFGYQVGETAFRDIAFCSYVVSNNSTLVVPDATFDPRFKENVYVKNGSVRFYAGAPLKNISGHCIGTLCVLDKQRRILTPYQVKCLEYLASLVMSMLSLKLSMEEKQIRAGEGENEKITAEAKRLAALMRSQFLANLSHEIRTPINILIGLVDLIRSNPQEREKLLDEIVETLKNMLRKFMVFLDYASLELKSLKLKICVFDLLGTLRNLLISYEHRSRAMGIDFKVDLPEGEEFVDGDPERVTQVVAVILDNALEFSSTNQNSVKFVFRVIECVDDLKTFYIEVSDRGVGIPSAMVSTMFQPFQQMDLSDKRRHGGLGLSLPLAEYLVKQMNGEIGVDTVPEEGSKFWFFCKLRVAKASDPTDKESVREKLQNMKILVVDDNLLNLKILCKQLERNFSKENIYQAANGEMAVQKCHELMDSLGIIIMDCQMPVMDGYEATLEVLKFLPEVPIIALSANVNPSDMERCLQVGMKFFVQKPFKYDELLKAIVKFANQKDLRNNPPVNRNLKCSLEK